MDSLLKRESHRLNVSVLAVIFMLLVLLGSILLLYQYRQNYIAGIQSIDRDLNRVVNDSSKGLLHLQFSGNDIVPWQKEQGIALLSQSIRALARLIDSASSLAEVDELEERGLHIEHHIEELIAKATSVSDLEFKIAAYHLMSDVMALRHALRDQLETKIKILNRFFRLSVIAAFILGIFTSLVLWRLNRKRLHSDLELLEARRLLGEITDSLNDVFWSIDTASGRVLFISPSCASVYGAAQESIYESATARFERIHPQDQSRIQVLYEESMRGIRDGYDLIFRVRAPSGELRWIHEVAKPVFNREGAKIRLAGVARDVTEQYQLHQQHSLLQRAVAESPDVVLISEHDPGSEDRFVFANSAVENIFGLPPEVIQGQPVSTLFSETGFSEGAQCLLEALTQGRHQVFEVNLPSQGGADAVVDVALIPIPDGNGNVAHMTIRLREVTERKELERQLLQVQRMESIGELTGGIAHDFNNLLTVVRGNAGLLVEELATDPRLRPLAELICKAAARGADLIKCLLAFARRQPLKPEQVLVDELLTGLAPLLRRSIGDHIDLKLEFQEGLWPVLVDPAQLESSILNLAINARDAMGEVGRLALTASNRTVGNELQSRFDTIPAADYVEIRMQDTGIGLHEETTLRIFEPFYTTKQHGSGLGLSMVFGFVKQSGGYVDVVSRAGEGATFILYLPRIEAVEPVPPPLLESTSPKYGLKASILLVEDDELVHVFARGLLEAAGYRVLAATSGKQALELLRDNTDIDVLFTDVVMPEMSGRELALQAQLLRPDLKILYTSGYSSDVLVKNGRLVDGVNILHKPYGRSELLGKLHAVLDADNSRCE